MIPIRVLTIIIHYLHLLGRSVMLQRVFSSAVIEFPQCPQQPALESFLAPPPNSPFRSTAPHGEMWISPPHYGEIHYTIFPRCTGRFPDPYSATLSNSSSPSHSWTSCKYGHTSKLPDRNICMAYGVSWTGRRLGGTNMQNWVRHGVTGL